MRRRRTATGRRSGFTLIESIATIVVLATLGSAASFLIINSVDAYLNASTSAQLQAEVSIALDRAVRELRRIPLDPASPGIAPNIVGMNPAWIKWQDASGNDFQLLKSGGSSELKLEVDGNGTIVLLSDVTTFWVRAYDEDNALLPLVCAGDPCHLIRRIRLDLTVERNGISQSMHAKAYIRSTMNGAG